MTGCKSDHKGFPTLPQARGYMNSKGVLEPKEVIKDGAGETAPIKGQEALYAVANGTRIGIKAYWLYESFEFINCYWMLICCSETLEDVEKSPNNCHKVFRTRAQAESFIKDWNEACADIWRREIMKKLDEGYRPLNLDFNTESILHKPNAPIEEMDIMTEVDLERLNLDRE